MSCYAQDYITKTTGDSIPAKVLEITSSEIKYKKVDNPNGPTYSVLKSDIFYIRYENGSTEIITKMEPRQFVIIPGKQGHSFRSKLGQRFRSKLGHYFICQMVA